MSRKDHWEKVYSTKRTEQLGWYAPHLHTSLSWIKGLALASDAPIIDVGGGASTLVDDLMDNGYESITVLDVSQGALAKAKVRLGNKAERVTWLNNDIISANLPSDYYELWHDRAVFHFLIEPGDRRKYRDNLLAALTAGGHLIIGTFAPEAPPTCSGLPVQRYSPDQLQDALGEEFELQRDHKEMHVTPRGLEQIYLYCHFQRMA